MSDEDTPYEVYEEPDTSDYEIYKESRDNYLRDMEDFTGEN